MLRKGLAAVALLVFFLPTIGLAAPEQGVPIAPRPCTGEISVSEITLSNSVQLARGYGWKRARKKMLA